MSRAGRVDMVRPGTFIFPLATMYTFTRSCTRRAACLRQELYNYFFSSGFIKPKKKASKPKPTPQQMEQYFRTLNLRPFRAAVLFSWVCCFARSTASKSADISRPGAKAAAVKKAYRQLALRFHPDKNQDSSRLSLHCPSSTLEWAWDA